MRPSWRAHWPAQLTTISAVIGPSVVGPHDGISLAGLLGRQRLAVDALRVGHGGRAAQQHHALLGARDGERAALLPAGGEARFGLELGIELGAGADQPRQFWELRTSPTRPPP